MHVSYINSPPLSTQILAPPLEESDWSTIKFISDGSIIDFRNVNVLIVLVQLPRLIMSLSEIN